MDSLGGSDDLVQLADDLVWRMEAETVLHLRSILLTLQ